MTPQAALRRYRNVFIPSMAIYLLSVFGVTLAIKTMEIPVVIAYGLALIPAICVWWFIYGYGRFIMETDEYRRHREIRSIMFATAAMLAFSTGWGLLEELVDAPRFPVFYMIVIYSVAFGAVSGFRFCFKDKA